jgi:ubiquinone/menaquinone biosynthesis C-methylase UbiE
MSNNHNKINEKSWNAYQEDYMKFELLQRPDYFEFFANGGVDLDEFLLPLAGDVKGLRLLDTCCAADAIQAFSWHNLGAKVTACDITPKAIEIASENAAKMKLDVNFVVADMQTIEPIGDNQYDIVFATYLVWIEDINEACKNWYRVLKTGGKLLLFMEHPITYCLSEEDNEIKIVKDYNKPSFDIFETFDGTPKARQFGGWSVNLPSVEHFYRISDVLNAVINADFKIKTVYESKNEKESGRLSQMPCDFVIAAVK